MRIVLGFLLFLAAGCADRPIAFNCPGFENYLVPIPITPGGPVAPLAGVASLSDVDEAPINEAFDRALSGSRLVGGPRNIAVLSGGGKWGAYGAGLNEVWGQQEDAGVRRPQFDIVTGISTGALQSIFIFIGTREADRALVEAYNIRHQRQLANSHGRLFFLHSGSMGDLRPLIDYARQRLRPYMSTIAAEASHRTLMIGVVNANSGNLFGVDITRIAASNMPAEQREECVVGALLASAAIPVVFQQVRINGVPYFDAGVRQAVFLAAVQRKAAERLAASPEGGNLYVLFNGDPGVSPRRDVPPTLLGAAGRLREITFDQIEQSSVYAVSQLATGMPTYVATARGHNCPMTTGDEDFFDPEVMDCLIRRGRERWSEGNPWIRYPLPPAR